MYMNSICLNFRVHLPYYYKRYNFFDIGINHDYYDTLRCEHEVKRASERCYIPANNLMMTLIERYPEADIVFMTPLHRATENRANRPSLCEFVKVIREVAEFYSLPVLDLYAMSGIQPQLEIHKKKYAPDGLHPNDAGAEKIADRLGAFILSL